jgi:hypothetical protein
MITNEYGLGLGLGLGVSLDAQYLQPIYASSSPVGFRIQR